jgi:hypothetical protein
MIEQVIKNHGGLHNRVTRQLLLEPFSLRECEEFFRDRGIVLDRYKICEAYMILGGIPFYLDLLEAGLSLPQNIDMLFFAKNAPLANEFDNLYASLFRKPEGHIKIVETLARNGSGLTREELAEKARYNGGGTLTKILLELEQCGFICKYRDFTRQKSGHYYKLVDFYTIFYLKYLRGNLSQNVRFWQTHSQKGEQLAWCGLAFERVCAAHSEEIKQKLGIAGVLTDMSAWRSRNSQPASQIDLVIDRDDSVINLCEIKYAKRVFTIDKAYSAQLNTKREVFRAETKSPKALHLTLITTYGVTDNVYRGEIQSVVTMDDLFAPI